MASLSADALRGQLTADHEGFERRLIELGVALSAKKLTLCEYSSKVSDVGDEYARIAAELQRKIREASGTGELPVSLQERKVLLRQSLEAQKMELEYLRKQKEHPDGYSDDESTDAEADPNHGFPFPAIDKAAQDMAVHMLMKALLAKSKNRPLPVKPTARLLETVANQIVQELCVRSQLRLALLHGTRVLCRAFSKQPDLLPRLLLPPTDPNHMSASQLAVTPYQQLRLKWTFVEPEQRTLTKIVTAARRRNEPL
eukprot:TRINITY_DN70539_c0_g1_i1.p1 TRINITY_DN70539_c0_g1~~TRINITY_DN70539_c0_g1_i1.p1  ORF type:complete len:256 (+),score=59.58 TRINITY_DN70539_c0_g1_i1:241-1008(+)